MIKLFIGVGRRMCVGGGGGGGGAGLAIRLMTKPVPGDINIILKVTKKRSSLIYSNKTFSNVQYINRVSPFFVYMQHHNMIQPWL